VPINISSKVKRPGLLDRIQEFYVFLSLSLEADPPKKILLIARRIPLRIGIGNLNKGVFQTCGDTRQRVELQT